MPFAAALRASLENRDSEFPAEFMRGDSLEDVLNRYLLTVEQLGGDDVFTCILLLSADGKRLSYGAAPTVPPSYCRASESIEIGPRAGSCAAAAYLGRPVYSVDIEHDPVWGDYRDLALQHGFKSCWSTPIRSSSGMVIGTFAILHRTVGMPTREEIEAIDLITDHVADAITWSRDPHYVLRTKTRRVPPTLRLVSNQETTAPAGRLLAIARDLELKAADFDLLGARSDCVETAENFKIAAELSRMVAASIIAQIEVIGLQSPTT